MIPGAPIPAPSCWTRISKFVIWQKGVGSKDSAIAGSNQVLIQGLKKLYDEILSKIP